MIKQFVTSDNSTDDNLRIGVFICHCGGNISDVVDVKRVVDEIGHIRDVARVVESPD